MDEALSPDDPRRASREERLRRRADPNRPGFLPESLDKSVIALPLLYALDEEEQDKRTSGSLGLSYEPRRVIIDLNLEFEGGRSAARTRVRALLKEINGTAGTAEYVQLPVQPAQYVFARMTGPAIRRLAEHDAAGGNRPGAGPAASPVVPTAGMSRNPGAARRAIYRIWPDFVVSAHLTRSLSTIKADAARSSFAAGGEGIVWAVLDSGVAPHPHFDHHKNLDLPSPLKHYDFTGDKTPLKDPFGHGTHVAGILAGEIPLKRGPQDDLLVRATGVSRMLDEHGEVSHKRLDLTAISGVAPRCKIVSMRVLDAGGKGNVSGIIAALTQVQEINGHGRRLLIHGVNLSVGYGFDPEWFACGHSPVCVEVDRLVRSGVVVVVSAGNSGYGFATSKFLGSVAAGLSLSINDPGNADLAITVGSTHREMPHTYGVSYFSSKGPTGDGRLKPDVLAPGEQVLSCAAGLQKANAVSKLDAPRGASPDALYVEQSGTSMAAPHVSGAIAAFLSIRREFIGQPDDVKRIFLATATDLKRDRYFQGAGLIDLMRAIQSV